jgi:hypothetical protein
VLQIPDAYVVHHGFWTWVEGRSLTRRDWSGIGAACAKQLKCRNLAIVTVIAHEVVWFGLIKPVVGVLIGRRHNGVRRIGYFTSGFIAGLRTPVDARTVLHVNEEAASTYRPPPHVEGARPRRLLARWSTNEEGRRHPTHGAGLEERGR